MLYAFIVHADLSKFCCVHLLPTAEIERWRWGVNKWSC